MNSIPAIFASDFDGTIFFRHNDPQISPDLLPAINLFRSRGGLFGFCSGRPTGAIAGQSEDIPTPDFIIGSSGARIIDQCGQLLFERHFSPELAELLIAYAKQKHATCSVHADGEFCVLQGNFGSYFSDDQIRCIDSLRETDGQLIHDVSLKTPSFETAAEYAAE